MKGTYKLALILIVIGLALAVVSIPLGAGSAVYWDNNGIHVVKNSGKNNGTNKIKELDLNAFESIDIEAGFANVEFIESNKYGLEIQYSDTEPSWSVNNGKLKINYRENDRPTFYMFNFGWNLTDKDIIRVYLPKSASRLDDVKIKTSSGSINVGGFSATDISIKNSSGNVDISRVDGNNFDIGLTSGRLKCTELEARKININSSSGNVEFKSVNSDKLSAIVTSGSISFDDCKIVELNAKSSSGKIEGRRLYTDGASINATSGRIDIEGGFTGITDIQSSSGSIKVTTSENKGSYSSSLSASSGRVTYDNESYGNRMSTGDSQRNTLNIKATSGNIDVYFK